eukprot:4895790-Pyramimonas_sp.AAC.1
MHSHRLIQIRRPCEMPSIPSDPLPSPFRPPSTGGTLQGMPGGRGHEPPVPPPRADRGGEGWLHQPSLRELSGDKSSYSPAHLRLTPPPLPVTPLQSLIF